METGALSAGEKRSDGAADPCPSFCAMVQNVCGALLECLVAGHDVTRHNCHTP
jgi:hypothetical protein